MPEIDLVSVDFVKNVLLPERHRNTQQKIFQKSESNSSAPRTPNSTSTVVRVGSLHNPSRETQKNNWIHRGSSKRLETLSRPVLTKKKNVDIFSEIVSALPVATKTGILSKSFPNPD